VCGNSARTDPCGGRSAMSVPTANTSGHRGSPLHRARGMADRLRQATEGDGDTLADLHWRAGAGWGVRRLGCRFPAPRRRGPRSRSQKKSSKAPSSSKVSSARCDAPSGPAGPTHRLLVPARERDRPPAHFRCLLKPTAAAPLFYRNAMRLPTGARPETWFGKGGAAGATEGTPHPRPGPVRVEVETERGQDPRPAPGGDDRTRAKSAAVIPHGRAQGCLLSRAGQV
jgi:hypothetical protein